MYTFKLRKEFSSATEGILETYLDGKYITLNCIFKDYDDKYYFISSSDNKTAIGEFKTIDDAISAIKSQFDPFQDAIYRINKLIDQRVSDAKHTMHLRISNYRGILFSQITALRYGYSQEYRETFLDDLIITVKKIGS